jgi:hypothetical protein
MYLIVVHRPLPAAPLVVRALHAHGRGARTDACGRSFPVLSTQVSTAGLRLRLVVPRPMPAVVASRDAGFISWAAEQGKYCSLCTVTLDPSGDLPFTSWGRWQCLRGGADVGLNSCYAVCGCGTEHRCGALPGEDVWRHA